MWEHRLYFILSVTGWNFSKWVKLTSDSCVVYLPHGHGKNNALVRSRAPYTEIEKNKVFEVEDCCLHGPTLKEFFYNLR